MSGTVWCAHQQEAESLFVLKLSQQWSQSPSAETNKLSIALYYNPCDRMEQNTEPAGGHMERHRSNISVVSVE